MSVTPAASEYRQSARNSTGVGAIPNRLSVFKEVEEAAFNRPNAIFDTNTRTCGSWSRRARQCATGVLLMCWTLSMPRAEAKGPAAAVSVQPASPWTRVLPISRSAMALLAAATERSSIITSLLQSLEETDVVVYITDMMPGPPGKPPSYLAFLSWEASVRYLLVRIDTWRLSEPDRIALLGHELQHALEVAAAPEVRDAASLGQLYRRIGWEGQRDQFESDAARTVGHLVRSELSERVRKGRPAAMVSSPSSPVP